MLKRKKETERGGDRVIEVERVRREKRRDGAIENERRKEKQRERERERERERKREKERERNRQIKGEEGW